LLRAAIEADAQAAWLMAARESHAVRVQRRFLERADSFKESIRMIGRRDPKHWARARTLVRRARRLGLIAARPKSAAHRTALLSELQSIARRRATMTTQIISLYGTSQVDGRPKGEFVYQLLSGLAHADTWANMTGVVPLTRIGPGHQLGELPLDVDMLLNCLVYKGTNAWSATTLKSPSLIQVFGIPPAVQCRTSKIGCQGVSMRLASGPARLPDGFESALLGVLLDYHAHRGESRTRLQLLEYRFGRDRVVCDGITTIC
jgi:hypothetical protein